MLNYLARNGWNAVEKCVDMWPNYKVTQNFIVT